MAAAVPRGGKQVHLGVAPPEEAALSIAQESAAQMAAPPFASSSRERKVKSEEQPPDMPAGARVKVEELPPMPAGAGDMLHDERPVLLEPVPPLAPEPPRKPPPSADPAHLVVYEAYVAIYDAVALKRGRVQSLNAKRRKRHNEILFNLGQTSNIRIDEPGAKAAKLYHSQSHWLNSDGPGSRVKVEELPPMPAGAHVKVEELPPMPPDARIRIEHAS